MTNDLAGVGFALLTAVFWAIGPIAHAAAGRRIGAFRTLLIRSVAAMPLLLGAAWLTGSRWPRGEAAAWMAASGVLGVGLADLLTYSAFVALGGRRAVQILTLAPVFTVAAAWAWLGEALPPRALAGAALAMGATAWVVWIERGRVQEREPGRVTPFGVACGVGGAILTGLAAVLVRRAYLEGPLDPVAAAALRVGAATAFLWLLPPFTGGYAHVLAATADRPAMTRMWIGTALGPVLGMLTYVAAIGRLEAGLVSTLVALSPLVALPASALRYRARIGWEPLAAAVVAVAGVALISLR